MDFGVLPPEINSARMYAGPGLGPMMSAAAAWDGLAAQLRWAATSYSSAISELTTGWQGPSSATMAAAAAPYAVWINSTAARAEQTAAQARAAAAAYETAFAATVPLPVIAANRTQLASLVATNVLGQNAPAIAATEAQYADMWSQDAAAMYGYASQSAAATRITPFDPPPQTTNPAGAAAQSAAAGQATHAAAGTNAQSALSRLMSATPATLQSLAAPGAAADPPADPTSLLSLLGPTSPLSTAASLFEAPGHALVPATDTMVTNSVSLVIAARTINDTAVSLEGPLFARLGSSASALGAAGPAVSAGVGQAGLVGGLSVPPSWAVATPTVRLAATVLQGTSALAVPVVAAETAGSIFDQMALASVAGGALGAALPRAISGTAARAGRFSSGEDTDHKDHEKQTPENLKRVLAELSQKPESVQHWHTDKAHLERLLERLSSKPGIHAVHVSSSNRPKPPSPKGSWG